MAMSLRKTWLGLLLVIALGLLQQVSAACYNPSGTDRNNRGDTAGTWYYEQCADSMMCCRTNTSTPQDTCHGDGLCQDGAGNLWRESCADETWQDPGCLKLCADNSFNTKGVALNSTDIRITVCPDGSLCCGDATEVGATGCCINNLGFRIVDGEVVSQRSLSSSSSGTSSSSSTSTSSGAGSSTSSPPGGNQSHSSSTGAIVGGVVGGVGGLALVVAGVFLFLRRHRKNAYQDVPPMPFREHVYAHYENDTSKAGHMAPPPPPPQFLGGEERYELNNAPTYELDGSLNLAREIGAARSPMEHTNAGKIA